MDFFSFAFVNRRVFKFLKAIGILFKMSFRQKWNVREVRMERSNGNRRRGGRVPSRRSLGPRRQGLPGTPAGGPGGELPSLSHKGPIYPSVRRSASADSSPLKPVLPSCFL